MAWFKKKEQCAHCQENKTKRSFEHRPTCVECRMKTLMDREAKRVCPLDGTTLVKFHRKEIIIDRCPKCEGIWLDAGELDAIKEVTKQEGMGSGVALGMIIG